MESYQVYHHLVEHLQVLQVGDRLWLVVEEVHAEKQVVEVDEHELAAWALNSEEGDAKDYSSHNEQEVVANLIDVVSFHRVVKFSENALEPL